MSDKYIDCLVYNKSLGFELPVSLLSETAAILNLSDEKLKETNDFIEINKNYANWILDNKEYAEVFQRVADFVNLETRVLINVFFQVIVREDQLGYETFCTKKYNKNSFLEAFKNYMKIYMIADVNNVISPDILLTTVCYILYNKYQKLEFEIAQTVIQYLLPIKEIKSENPPNFQGLC